MTGAHVPPRQPERPPRLQALAIALFLGMGAAIVPLIAWGHRTGFGFDKQYLVLAVSAGTVLTAACFLPAWGHKDARSLSESNTGIKHEPEVS